MEKMLIKLQEAIALQGEEISQMSNEIYTQQKEIMQLRAQLIKLKSKIELIQGDDADSYSSGLEAPPPHY